MKSGKLQGSIFKIKILAFAGILLLIWCGYRLIKTGLEEQQDYEFLAVSEEQEIPQEFLEELAERRGVTVVSAVLDVPVRLEIEGYRMEVTAEAVDMETFPLHIEECLTGLETGSKIPVFFTARSLDNLTDRYSYAITKSRKKELQNRALGMTVCIAGAAAGPVKDAASDSSGNTEQNRQVPAGTEGILAARVRGEDGEIYLSYESGRKLLEAEGQNVQVKKIYIKLHGKSAADALKNSLLSAGLRM